MTRLDTLAAVVVVVLWGANFVAAKVGTAEIPPLLLTGIRFVLVAAVLVPLYGLPRRALLPGLLLLSWTLGIGHFGLLFLGIPGVDAATAAVAIQLTVPFSAVLAALVFADLPGWRRSAGILLAFSGVAVLAGEPTLPDPWSFALLVLAALAWAVSNVVIKRLPPANPVAVNGWVTLLTAPQLLILSLLAEDNQMAALTGADWAGWLALAYTVVAASLIAYSLWYYLLAKYTMNQVVPFTLLGPVIGVACGIALLDESLTWYKAVGGAVTILGVAIVQFSQPRSRPQGPT